MADWSPLTAELIDYASEVSVLQRLIGATKCIDLIGLRDAVHVIKSVEVTLHEEDARERFTRRRERGHQPRSTGSTMRRSLFKDSADALATSVPRSAD